MEAAPPSYAASTVIDYWDIVARYVPSNDLCSAALVCSRWHGIFAPHLWGNPASHFGIENDRVYVALTKFKRTLQIARLLVRSMTHTLHLPPAHAEIYNGPHSDWLRDILERLPNLQSLIVRGLPFFDHTALQALRYSKPKQNNHGPPSGVIELPGSAGFAFQSTTTVTSFGLRLLDASRCSNVTGRTLAQALSRFEALLYLDLSFTYPARDTVVLSSLCCLSGLQVLKLRGISLNDTGIGTLAHAIGLRVRSLDIRDNQISDVGVRTLLDKCFVIGELEPAGGRSPGLLPYLGSEMLQIYQGEDFEGYLRNTFTTGFVSRLAIEDAPEGGITHLYIAGNSLTVEGASGLIRSGRLHVLDIANVVNDLARHPSLSGRYDSEVGLNMPGVEKLTPLLAQTAPDRLTFLRIDHAIVTHDVPGLYPDEVIPGRAELDDTALPDNSIGPFELNDNPVRPEAFELPTTQTPRLELPGDPMNFVVSPAISSPQHADEDNEPESAIRRGSAFAPECVDSLATDAELMMMLSPVSALWEGMMSSSWCPTPLTAITPTQLPTRPATTGRRERGYSSVAMDRKARLAAHTSGSHNMHPAMLPHVRTLVLTDVPCFAPSRDESDRLICFIKQCAEEAGIARAKAKQDYALPPGRRGHVAALKASADKIFALKRLVLEMAPEQNRRKNSKASPWQHMTTKSMTDDRDTETLWSAAETDFSFFGDSEESNYPSLDPGRFAHSFNSNEKEVSLASGARPPLNSMATKPPSERKYDTVALLSTFRKERKLAHQRNIAAGAVDVETEGYWDGLIQVVRPSGNLRSDEEVDYYGNRFVGGWLYR